jgi:copper homeostasis protein (lipoprotein)
MTLDPRFIIAPIMTLTLLAGCGMGADGEQIESSEPLGSLAGVYSGVLPCSNCSAIAATLWLRRDGRFVFKQSYLDESREHDGHAFALGRWRWDDGEALLVLSGAGPERRFAQLDEHRLELQTAAEQDPVLARETVARPFADRLRLVGESVVEGVDAVFTECASELRLEVAPGRGHDELRRQHRMLSRPGRPALTEVEAHIERVTRDDTVQELLMIDRFIVLKPHDRC